MIRVVLKLLATGVVLGAVVVGGYWLWSGHNRISAGADQFVIEPGDGVSRIAHRLVEQGIIAEPYSFILWSYQRGYTSSLKVGEYRIEPDTTLVGLLEQFQAGEVVNYSVTLIEGWTFRQFRDRLATQDKLRHTIGPLSDSEIMSKLGHPGLHPEGRFFPDTYVFSANTTDIDLLSQAFDRMSQVAEEEWAKRSPDTPLKSIDEALILASIIEKETGKPEERAEIGGVFHNRLDRKMRLQTDPTVIYGLGEEFDGNLKRSHLKKDTPYNTYTRFGLPPTPIANPGRDAINAALHPADTKALYFVSRGDGSHEFSEDLDAHNKAVIKYQLGGKKKSFSSNNENQ